MKSGPLPFSSQFLNRDGLRYHYVAEGTGDVLLCVHGNPTWSYHWRHVIRHFRDRYRVIAVDHIGCGLSDKPADYPYTLAQHVDNLAHLVRELDLRKVTLIAQDWGGAIGLGAAVQLPARFSRFVLGNTGAFRAPTMPWRIRAGRIPILGKVAIQGFNLFLRAALRMAFAQSSVLNADERAAYLAPYDSWANRQAIWQFVQDIPMNARHRSYATLAQIEAGLSLFRDRPLQLVWGMQDWCFTPWFLHRFQEIFPQARTHEIPTAGHWVFEEAHAEVCAVIDEFLKSSPA